MKVNIKVHPNSKASRIDKNEGGTLHIYVKEPAKENKANLAVIEKLSELYNVPKTSITIKSGVKSKYKIFEIQ